MVNPFDRTFFKFFFGFLTILLLSFCVLFFANRSNDATDIDTRSLTATQK
ncbi:MAG: hypothetical protein P4L61_03205 [Candidatus Pacebacteria bacterium]|nr:hypothetical protein [Candidatus Paceibacterota bacterium]